MTYTGWLVDWLPVTEEGMNETTNHLTADHWQIKMDRQTDRNMVWLDRINWKTAFHRELRNICLFMVQTVCSFCFLWRRIKFEKYCRQSNETWIKVHCMSGVLTLDNIVGPRVATIWLCLSSKNCMYSQKISRRILSRTSNVVSNICERLPMGGLIISSLPVFPVKPWTPEKISGMFIVLWPIRCEMKPQKITDKSQQGSVTLYETMSWSVFLREMFNFPFVSLWKRYFLLQTNTGHSILSVQKLNCRNDLKVSAILKIYNGTGLYHG